MKERIHINIDTDTYTPIFRLVNMKKNTDTQLQTSCPYCRNVNTEGIVPENFGDMAFKEAEDINFECANCLKEYSVKVKLGVQLE